MYHNLKEGAIFVADSHFNLQRKEFSSFLKLLENGELNTTQLFLMGDIFDFITQESFYFIKQNQDIVTRLNALSSKIEIFYFEGNHDYNLKDLFPNITVIARENQPLLCKYNEKKVALSHGDIFTNTSYNIYCKVIRNRALLKFLNAIDFKNWLSIKIEKSLEKKIICRNFEGFEKLVEKKVQNYQADIIIEGHFHQGKSFLKEGKKYVNIPSLFCQKEFTVFKDGVFVNQAL